MDSKISGFQPIDQVRLADKIPVLQVSNTSQSPQGSTVSATVSQLLTLFQTLLGQDVQNYYETIPAMLAAQDAQNAMRFQFVTNATADPSVASGYAYYEYLGTVNEDLTDYRKLSNSELNLNDKTDKGGYAGTAMDLYQLVIGGGIDFNAPDKATPVGADKLTLIDSDTGFLANLTLTNIVTYLRGLFKSKYDDVVAATRVTGTYNIDWNKDVYDLDLSGPTTLTQSNVPVYPNGKTILIIEKPNGHTLTYPNAAWSTNKTGERSLTLENTHAIQAYNGKYKRQITQPS